MFVWDGAALKEARLRTCVDQETWGILLATPNSTVVAWERDGANALPYIAPWQRKRIENLLVAVGGMTPDERRGFASRLWALTRMGSSLDGHVTGCGR